MARCIYLFLRWWGASWNSVDICGANETEGGVEVLRLPNRVGAGNSFGMLGDRLIVLRFVLSSLVIDSSLATRVKTSQRNPFSWLQPRLVSHRAGHEYLPLSP